MFQTEYTTVPSALDPRTHLILAFFFAVLVTATGNTAALGAELGVVLALVLWIRRTAVYARWLRLVLPMALFFGAVTWWTADVNAGLFAALKLLTLTSVFFVFFALTDPGDLANALMAAGLPYPLAFVVGTALQFVPVVGRKACGVLDAQRARGIPVGAGWAAVRHWPAFLMPLLIQSFQMAEELAEAMEARGFGRPGRSFLVSHRLRAVDGYALAAGGLLLAGGLGWILM